jgi:hypothetical protein
MAEIGLSDLGHQLGPLGQVVQRLPERVRQNANEIMSLRTPAAMVPDRPQAELALMEDPTQAELFGPFQAILSPLAYGQLQRGWQHLFRCAILKLLPA